jgi:hypothetical protein
MHGVGLFHLREAYDGFGTVSDLRLSKPREAAA